MKNILLISILTLLLNACATMPCADVAISNNKILSSKITYKDEHKAYFEVEYIYDGVPGKNANIVITPVSDIPHWTHETIKVVKGRNKVNVKVEHPSRGNSPDVIKVTHAEIALRVTLYNEKHKTDFSEKIASIMMELQHEFHKK